MWLFIMAAFVLACFGALLLAAGERNGAWFLGFGALLEAMVLMQVLRPGWRYSVGPDGIEIRRALRSHAISRNEITAVEAVDAPRIEEILAGPQRAEVDAGRAMDLAGGFRARRELGRILSYTSAPVVLTQTRRGGPLSVRKVGARASGRFVLVTLADGALRALSPRDVDGFVRSYHGPRR